MNISQEDFGTLCICALRYCHGRRTYMPSLVQGIVGAHLKELSDKDIGVMVNDADHHNGLDIRLYGEAEQDWLTFEEKVRAEVERRCGMTRDEAMYLLNNLRSVAEGKEDEAIDMAIEELQREEAEEKGYCHRIRPSNVEVVVRCKDCRHRDLFSCPLADNDFQKDEDFCSWGERREP